MVASGVCSCCAAVADLFCCSVIAMEMQFTRVRLNAEGEGPQPFCPTKEEVRCQIMPLMHARDSLILVFTHVVKMVLPQLSQGWGYMLLTDTSTLGVDGVKFRLLACTLASCC